MEEILKWTFLVLAAGFVGYFGRYLAMELIRRFGARKYPPGADNNSRRKVAHEDEKSLKKRLKTLAKAEKKRLKAESKKEKE